MSPGGEVHDRQPSTTFISPGCRPLFAMTARDWGGMSPVNRRGFLQLAGGAAAMTALSPSIDRAAAIPADRRTGTLADIDHIVVLMPVGWSATSRWGSRHGPTLRSNLKNSLRLHPAWERSRI
jgi:hypothetical protein